MNFLQSIETCFTKYALFDGRASRSEYWWFYLFFALSWAVGSVMSPAIGTIVGLVLLLPYFAVTARRLHDINNSGWLQLIGFIPLVGWIILIVWCATEGEKKKNRFGPPIKFKRRR